jgi:ABC-2 type transport system ATP-binding protein
MRRLQEQGTTIVLTTHYLQEAETLCDRIAILNHGRLIACDTTRALKRRLDSKELGVTVAEEIASVPESLRRFRAELAGTDRLVFQYPPSKTQAGELLAAVGEAGLTIVDVATREVDLEDVFLRLCGEAEGAPPVTAAK